MDEHPTVGASDARSAPDPERAGRIAGDLVTETFGYDGGRRVTVYVPPIPPEAVVLAGDGQLTSQWAGTSGPRTYRPR